MNGKGSEWKENARLPYRWRRKNKARIEIKGNGKWREMIENASQKWIRIKMYGVIKNKWSGEAAGVDCEWNLWGLEIKQKKRQKYYLSERVIQQEIALSNDQTTITTTKLRGKCTSYLGSRRVGAHLERWGVVRGWRVGFGLDGREGGRREKGGRDGWVKMKQMSEKWIGWSINYTRGKKDWRQMEI